MFPLHFSLKQNRMGYAESTKELCLSWRRRKCKSCQYLDGNSRRPCGTRRGDAYPQPLWEAFSIRRSKAVQGLQGAKKFLWITGLPIYTDRAECYIGIPSLYEGGL